MGRAASVPGSEATATGAAARATTVAGPFRALGWHFDVETDDPALTDLVARVFGSLADPRGDAAPHRYALTYATVDGEEQCSIALDGAPIETSHDPARPLAMLIWHVNRSVVEHAGDLLLLHASGAALDSAAVVLPGDMEVGKTTFVTGLVRAGLSYLSDEVVAIAPDASLRAFPRALSLDPGSWPLFPDLEPRLDPTLQRYLPYQWQVPPTAIRPDAVVHRAEARLLVFPRWKAGSSLELAELAGVDALLTLARCAFNFHGAPERNLELLGQVVRGCRAFTLTYDDLVPAVARVVELLRDAASEAPSEPTR